MRDFGLGPRIDMLVEAILKIDPDYGRDGSLAPLWFPRINEIDKFPKPMPEELAMEQTRQNYFGDI